MAATAAAATSPSSATNASTFPPPPMPVTPATSAQMNQAAVPPSMDTIFSADGKVDMQLLMMSLWKNRKDQAFTRELCTRLSHLAVISNPTLDQVEFYLPQLAHMVIHLEQELPIADMEQFVLLLSQSSVHFALQLFWIIYAALDENRPKRGGNQRTFARCAQLLVALEQCLVYGSPVARELSDLLTRNSISRAEMDQLLMADRRFFAAQSSAFGSTSDLAAVAEGWLYKKGGGTSKMGRRNWKLRWCRIEKRVLLVFAGPNDLHPRTAVPLDRAEVRVVENAKHPFYFELIHDFSETKMKFAAQSQDDLLSWVQHLHKAAAAPAPPALQTSPTRTTLARMSIGMRSFILHSAAGTETPRDGSSISADVVSPPTGPATSPPGSPRSHAQNKPSFGTSDAWSESQRRTRTISSVSSASAQSSDVSEMTAILADSLFVQAQPPLPFDQQRRYEFFTGMITFVKAITDVSEALRRVEPTKRKCLLRPQLEQLKVPLNAYLPLCKSTDVYCRVRSVFTDEGRVFSTNERAPCLLFFETEENELGQDVSQCLFDHLYADDGDSSDDQDAAVAVADVDEAVLLATRLKTTAANPPLQRRPSATSTSKNAERSQPSTFLQQLLAEPKRKQHISNVFGELSFTASERLQGASARDDPSRWRLCTLIAKSYDDLRQEVLVMQLISYFQHIFDLEELPLRLHPYRILSTGASTGLIEVVRNATSLDGIKKTPGFKNLRHHFEQLYGDTNDEGGSEFLRQAELNFTHSLAAYSIVCYILCIKDRHNGNILLDVEGHLVHIDFGFFLGRAPGGSFSFETAPFKLTAEMVDVLGGRHSTNFKYYCDLCVRGALAARKHAETIYTLVEVMSFHSKLPCFVGSATTPAVALAGLRERLFLTTPEDKVEAAILQMIERSYDHFGTTKYDQFQVFSNGIAM